LGLHFKQLLSAGNNGVVSLLIASRRFEAQALRATVLHGDIDALNLVLGSESSPVRSWLARTQQLDKRLLRTLLIRPNVKVFEAMILELSSTLLAIFDTELLNDLLLRAANNGWPNMVAHLIERGAQINELIGFAQVKSLERSCKAGHQEVVQILLDIGAKICGSELRQAAQHGHTSTVRTLLERRVNADPIFTKGCLYAAARKGFVDVVQLLLDFGANPNNGNRRPLLGALESEHTGMVRLLVDRGAKICPILPEARKRPKLQSMLDVLREIVSSSECHTQSNDQAASEHVERVVLRQCCIRETRSEVAVRTA